MAKNTRLQLRAAAREELLEPVAARWTDAQLNRYLNDGQEDLARTGQTRTRATAAVNTGESSVAAPSTILIIERVWWESVGTRSPLRWSNSPFEPDTTSQGRPVIAWLEDDVVRFWPAAQEPGALLFKGKRWPAIMGTDESTHGLPDYECSNEALIAYCVWKAYESDFDPQRDIWGAKYTFQKGRFAAQEAEKNPQTGTVRNVYDDPERLPLTPWDYL